MKKIFWEFIRRGLMACGFGPVILAVLYLILRYNGVVETLTVNEVCTGIFSISALAFIAGGMNVIYQVERLVLTHAIFIHGCVLYINYLATYLLNGCIEWGITPIGVFSGIFVVGYIAVWAIIYFVTKRNTKKLNDILEQKQWRTDK